MVANIAAAIDAASNAGIRRAFMCWFVATALLTHLLFTQMRSGVQDLEVHGYAEWYFPYGVEFLGQERKRKKETVPK